MKLYPNNTANRNVPQDVFLIAETEAMSGEIHYTYYADKEGTTFVVADWSGDKPGTMAIEHIAYITGQRAQDILNCLELWQKGIDADYEAMLADVGLDGKG